MGEREALARLLCTNPAYRYGTTPCFGGPCSICGSQADAILAAGWRPQATLAAALLRAHAAGRREAVEECAALIKQAFVGIDAPATADLLDESIRALAAGAGEKEGEG